MDIGTPISTEVDDYGRRYDGVVIKSYDVHQTRRLSEHFDRKITRSALKGKKGTKFGCSEKMTQKVNINAKWVPYTHVTQ